MSKHQSIRETNKNMWFKSKKINKIKIKKEKKKKKKGQLNTLSREPRCTKSEVVLGF